MHSQLTAVTSQVVTRPFSPPGSSHCSCKLLLPWKMWVLQLCAFPHHSQLPPHQLESALFIAHQKTCIFACCTCTAAPLAAGRLLAVSNGDTRQNYTLSLANNFNFKPLIFEDISYSEGLYIMSLKCLSNLAVIHSVRSSQEPIYFPLLLGNCFHKECCGFKPEISGKTAFNNRKIKTLLIWKLI